MFSMFDGYGSELATMLWIVFIPAALALARWYANYVKDRALATVRESEFEEKLVKLKKEVGKLQECTGEFEKFIVAYEAVQKAKKEGTGSFRRQDIAGATKPKGR